MSTFEKRFWSKVDKSGGPDACWIWTGAKSVGGYGHVWQDGHLTNASRVAWTLTNGPIPEGIDVCHHCDTTSCANPAHLFLGTAKENIQDAIHKGRWHQAGERNNHARLSQDQVTTIRTLYSLGMVQVAILSQQFGVSKVHIRRIVTYACWK